VPSDPVLRTEYIKAKEVLCTLAGVETVEIEGRMYIFHKLFEVSSMPSI
jgi:hypothetical protein